MQKLTDGLADLCLKNSDKYVGYTDEDLMNATIIFSHFLMDTIYRTNEGLSFSKKLEIAKISGQMIRELIKETTSLDMHEVVKNLGNKNHEEEE